MIYFDKTYKILVLNTIMVDINKLRSGIYETDKPLLYNNEETMQSLMDKTLKAREILGSNYVTTKYIDNLSKCSLMEVKLSDIK